MFLLSLSYHNDPHPIAQRANMGILQVVKCVYLNDKFRD